MFFEARKILAILIFSNPNTQMIKIVKKAKMVQMANLFAYPYINSKYIWNKNTIWVSKQWGQNMTFKFIFLTSIMKC